MGHSPHVLVSDYFVPHPRYAGHVSTISPLPRSYKEAFNDPNWRNAMFDEYNALIKNKTWTSVPRPEGANNVRSSGFGLEHPDYVCLLQRSLYGLKQAPRARVQRFAAYITTVGFTPSRRDSSLLIYRQGDGITKRFTEAEYRGVANAVAETCWIWNLLRELHTPLSSATIVYCDNVSVVYLSSNLVQHQRTKHIEIDIHFVWDLVATGKFAFYMFLLGFSMRISSLRAYLQRCLRSFAPV
ncbi:ribonuclease H-like domain-containing protein [Tanacetum coccineum]